MYIHCIYSYFIVHRHSHYIAMSCKAVVSIQSHCGSPNSMQNTSTVPSLIRTSCMRLLGILGPGNDCSIEVFLLEVCVLLEYLNVVMHGLQLSKFFGYLNTSRSQ